MYMPSLGFCMLLTFLLIKLTKTQISKDKFTAFNKLASANVSIFIIIFIITGFYAVNVYARNPIWKDDVSLFGHDVEVSDKSAKAHYRWGFKLLTDLYPLATSKEEADLILHKAESEFLKTLSIAGVYPEAYSHLGIIYQRTGQLDKSLAYSDSAIKYAPNVLGVHADKGFVLSSLGRYADAIAEFQTCIKIDPGFVLGYKNAGICYRNLNQNAKAVEFLDKAKEMDPTDVKNLNLLASAYQGLGDAA